jgi:transcriptional regulator with PAS, ATPase and Fis domain
MSQRTGNYVATNCAALPDTLAEAQLFGHRKGAFTGADRAAPGFFRSAHEGTLLLDEIGDLSPPAQAKVLRAIEERAIVPLGEAMPVPVDVRLIAAGQNDLRASVERGEFRGDLFARLNGLELRLPPLRERREEIVPIFKSVLEEHFAEPPQLDSAVVEKLCIYAWPFNVREVVQTARSVAALHPQAAELTSDLLPRSVTEGRSDKQSKSARPPTSRRAQMKMRDREQLRELVNALNTHGGNVARAAKAVGISRQRAYRLIEGSPDVDLDRVRSEMREKPDAPVDG